MAENDDLQIAKKWSDRWTSIAVGERGGQGATHQVKRLDKSGDQTARFLKCLHRQDDPERRRRMYREVAAYQTLSEHRGIPKLIESNASRFDDLEYKLYLVTELVDGVTVEQYVQHRLDPLSTSDARTCVLALLDVVEYCHANDVTHRDIKPANVLLEGGEVSKPVLVDFGLSFEAGLLEEAEDEAAATLVHTELGNRFLRLRELGAYSTQKRDPRSDLACVVGLFFYLLTKEAPVHTGTDSLGAFAHQRPSARTKLDRISDEQVRLRVNRVFDRGLQEAIDQRFQSAVELRHALIALDSSEELAGEELIEQVKAQLALSDRAAQGRIYARLVAFRDSMYSVLKELADELRMSLYGLEGQVKPDFVSLGFAIVPGATVPEPDQEIRYFVTPVGNEVVVELAGSDGVRTESARFPIDEGAATMTPALKATIRGFAIKKVRI